MFTKMMWMWAIRWIDRIEFLFGRADFKVSV